MATSVENMIAKRFIQRKDVKSEQNQSGAYYPNRSAWTRKDLEDHVSGRKSFGHYLVGQDGNAKLFAFDIDLTKWSETSGRPHPTWLPIDEDGITNLSEDPKPLVPREAWLHPKRPPELERYLIAQMRGFADILANITFEVLGIPVAASYSGGKGMHVYGFTGEAPAADVRGAAMEVVNYAGCFEPLRGKNFFMHKDQTSLTGYPCVDLEVFPKQDDLSDKDLGNLMRLPLGSHAVTGHKAQFVNLASYPDQLVIMDPVLAMEDGNPWQ